MAHFWKLFSLSVRHRLCSLSASHSRLWATRWTVVATVFTVDYSMKAGNVETMTVLLYVCGWINDLIVLILIFHQFKVAIVCLSPQVGRSTLPTSTTVLNIKNLGTKTNSFLRLKILYAF